MFGGAVVVVPPGGPGGAVHAQAMAVRARAISFVRIITVCRTRQAFAVTEPSDAAGSRFGLAAQRLSAGRRHPPRRRRVHPLRMRTRERLALLLTRRSAPLPRDTVEARARA